MSTFVYEGGGGVKKVQKTVHVVCACPLTMYHSHFKVVELRIQTYPLLHTTNRMVGFVNLKIFIAFPRN